VDNTIALQDRLHKDHPIRNCYGCGADNHGGLQIKSIEDGDEVVARWRPKPHHHAYPGYLNGGIASTLIDCHSAWTAWVEVCKEQGIELSSKPDEIPSLWTRAMTIEFLKPAPIDGEVMLRARVVKKGVKSRTVHCSLYSDGVECVKGEVTLVSAGS
jgi:acyl-coenzyme A thioesterase PaaI-like protein